MISPSATRSVKPDRSSPASRARNVSAVAVRSRCARISISRPSSPLSNSTLPRSVLVTDTVSPIRATASPLAEQPGPAQRGRRHGLGRGDGEPGRHAGAGVDGRRLAYRPGEPGEHLQHVLGHRRDQLRLLPDQRGLQLQVERVVGTDLGAEPVLERRDDPAPVGVVLRVGAGHQQQVQRQPQLVAADLDVALLQHVEQRHLDALGEVGQLVDGEDAAVGARHESEVDGLRVAEGAALRPPGSGRRRRSGRRRWCPGWRASRRTAASGAARRSAAASPVSAASRPDAGRDRQVRVLVELGARRSPASTRRAGPPGRGSAGSCPGPRSPSRTMSWPASSARSTSGSTVSS